METLDPATRAAIEIITSEGNSDESSDRIVRFRHLFQEKTVDELSCYVNMMIDFKTIGPAKYIEDELGVEIPFDEVYRFP